MKYFLEQLEDGEEYVNITCTNEVLNAVSATFNTSNYTVNYIKKKNNEHQEDSFLIELYKERSKINKKILNREYDINHGK